MVYAPPAIRTRRYEPPESGGGGWLLFWLFFLLVLAGGGAAGWYFLWGPGSRGYISSDLDLVPRDAAGLVSFRAADLWNGSVGEGFKAWCKKLGMSVADVEEKIGISPADIERLTVILPSLDEEDRDSQWVILAFGKACDQAKVVKALLGKDVEERTHEGKTYHNAGDPRNKAVYFVTDRIAVFGAPAIVKQVISKPRARTEGALQAACKELEQKHLLVAALGRLPSKARQKMAQGAPPALQKIVEGLDECQSTLLTVDEGTRLDFNLKLNFSDSAAARKFQTAAKGGLEELKGLLQKELKAAAPRKDSPEREVLEMLEATAKKVTVELEGAQVELRARTPDSGRDFGSFFAVTFFMFQPRGDNAKVGLARSRVRMLESACAAYRVGQGDYPESLQQLTQKTDKGGPYLADPGALLDPWNQPYLYDRVGTRNGGAQPDIWTINPANGEEIGNWGKK
jgi:hypothetical protein